VGGGGPGQQPRTLLLPHLCDRLAAVVGPGPLVRDTVAPCPGPLVEVGQGGEDRSLEEGLAHVADGPLHLALFVSSARGARTWLEVVVRDELDQAGVEVYGAALPLEHRRLEVVVQDHPRHPAEVVEAAHVAAEEALLGLVEEEFEVERAGEAQRHHEARQLPLRPTHLHLPEVGPVHLRLLAWKGDQTQERLLALRPKPCHHTPQALDRARVAPLPNHLQEPRGPQPRMPLERLAQEGHVRIQPARTKPPRPVQRVGLDRRAHRVPVDSELRGDGADLPVLRVVQPANGGELLRIQHLLTPRMGRPVFPGGRTVDRTPRRLRSRRATRSGSAA
jgi:hypothetical protein